MPLLSDVQGWHCCSIAQHTTPVRCHACVLLWRLPSACTLQLIRRRYVCYSPVVENMFRLIRRQKPVCASGKAQWFVHVALHLKSSLRAPCSLCISFFSRCFPFFLLVALPFLFCLSLCFISLLATLPFPFNSSLPTFHSHSLCFSFLFLSLLHHLHPFPLTPPRLSWLSSSLFILFSSPSLPSNPRTEFSFFTTGRMVALQGDFKLSSEPDNAPDRTAQAIATSSSGPTDTRAATCNCCPARCWRDCLPQPTRGRRCGADKR